MSAVRCQGIEIIQPYSGSPQACRVPPLRTQRRVHIFHTPRASTFAPCRRPTQAATQIAGPLRGCRTQQARPMLRRHPKGSARSPEPSRIISNAVSREASRQSVHTKGPGVAGETSPLPCPNPSRTDGSQRTLWQWPADLAPERATRERLFHVKHGIPPGAAVPGLVTTHEEPSRRRPANHRARRTGVQRHRSKDRAATLRRAGADTPHGRTPAPFSEL